MCIVGNGNVWCRHQLLMVLSAVIFAKVDILFCCSCIENRKQKCFCSIQYKYNKISELPFYTVLLNTLNSSLSQFRNTTIYHNFNNNIAWRCVVFAFVVVVCVIIVVVFYQRRRLPQIFNSFFELVLTIPYLEAWIRGNLIISSL